MNKCHILTLSWNGRDKLATLYSSLLPALKELDMDYCWHIRDNAASENDGSANEIKSWNNDKVNYIPISHNKDSYSSGMNFLFNQSNADDDDYVLCLNNDIQFNDTISLKNMFNIIKNDPDVGQVGAKLNYIGNNKIQHYGIVFSNYNNLPTNYCAGEEEDKMHKLNRLFPAITGALSLTTAKIFKLAPFNEKVIWAFDDVIQSLTIGYALNKKIVCCGNVSVSHHESASLKKNPVNKLFMNQNIKVFMENWYREIIRRGDTGLNEKYRDLNFRIYK